MNYDLGYVDLEAKTLQPLENPFGSKVFTYVAGTFCYIYVSGSDHLGCGGGGGIIPLVDCR